MAETILLVTGDAQLRQQATGVLQSHGYRVLEASRSPATLQLCRQQDGPIHLLMTDVLMPEINGHTLTEQVMALYPCITVLYMSGEASDALVALFDRTQSLALIRKPFTPDALVHKVRRLLSHAHPRVV